MLSRTRVHGGRDTFPGDGLKLRENSLKGGSVKEHGRMSNRRCHLADPTGGLRLQSVLWNNNGIDGRIEGDSRYGYRRGSAFDCLDQVPVVPKASGEPTSAETSEFCSPVRSAESDDSSDIGRVFYPIRVCPAE
jgi:hypothetical protein